MIPDFKTYIKESIWSDIQKRSTGETVRKEDDVNHLDQEGLYEYILSHYELINNEREMSYGSKTMIIPLSRNIDILLLYEFQEVHCFFNLKRCLVYSILLKKFNVDEIDYDHYIISPKDKYTNQFFIDVIDCIIENKNTILLRKKNVNESIWSDIQKRSAGGTVRREDDVDHMNFDTFADYIRDNYSEKGNWFSVAESDDGKSRHIEIDIIYRGEIDLSFNVVEGKIYNILVQGNKNYVDIPGLKEIFNVNRIGSSTFGVYEKNWTISNNTFVKLIEFFLKKKTNESIWSDIQKRSAGETVRKEDDVDNLDMEGFYDYLNDHYETLENTVIRKYDDIHTILVPIVSSELKFLFIEIDFDPDDITETKITISLIALNEIPYINESLRKAFCVVDRDKTPERGKHIEIYPKDGGESTIVTNTFCLEVLDFILKEAEGKYTILLKKK